ncbi:MAG: major facilitator superfamily 1 [Frankiales bacterium]|nr:major facilitator superfamily 1 [Frankiales bacterium]
MGTISGGGVPAVLRVPGVLRAAGPYGLSRVGVTMELLALLLFVHERTGSWFTAGLVNSCFATGAAVVAPVLGRTVDRRGQTGVLVTCSLLHLCGVVLVLGAAGSATGLALAGAALAGAAVPPASSCMRVLWSLLVPERLRTAAYAVESLLVEVAELAGPALVGVLVLLASPLVALVAAVTLVSGGSLAFAASPVSRSWRTRRSSPRPTGLVGPLRLRPVRLLTAVVLLGTAGFSALEVSVARFAAGEGHAGATGPLLGALVTGSLLGAWCYGRRPRTSPVPDQLVALMAATVLLSLSPLLAVDLWSMAALLLLTGTLIAPATSAQFMVMTEVAPEDSRTEAFTWASTAGFLGVALGTAVAGTVLDRGGPRVGLLLGAGLAVGALLATVRLRQVLRPARVEPVYTVWVEEYDEVVRERDEALAALRAYGERCDAMARELALLKQERRDAALAALGPQAGPADRPRLRAVSDGELRRRDHA